MASTAKIVPTLRMVLGMYPFSVGILRELLQNSDDAQATKQVFVLDCRTHSVDGLNHENLKAAQGPALLAFNDALFNEQDWIALQSTFESSKQDDSSKIGKYGIGFRSVYHLTDCPQILSGSILTVCDPLESFTNSPGQQYVLGTDNTPTQNQLAPFSHFLPQNWDASTFNGTVVRCSLRTRPSQIHDGVFSSSKISQLLRDYVDQEIDISLLFLKYLRTIDVYEIDEQGNVTHLGSTANIRSANEMCEETVEVHNSQISSTKSGVKTWKVYHSLSLEAEAADVFQRTLGFDPTSTFKRHKFIPRVGIAVPSFASGSNSVALEDIGKSARLFTYLPLETKTGFPVHIHALFALTQSRQNLKGEGTGIVPTSDDHVFVEWNRLLFNHFIPKTWTTCLSHLVSQGLSDNLFRAWPPHIPTAHSGDSRYWIDLPSNIFELVVERRLPIWPLYQNPVRGPPSLLPLEELVVVQPGTDPLVLKSLTALGMKLVAPPPYVVDIIKKREDSHFRVLSPEVAHGALLALGTFESANTNEVFAVINYLLSTKNVLNLVNLPLFTTSSGEIVSLLIKDQTKKTHTLLTRLEFELFGGCDPSSIALHLLYPSSAQILKDLGPAILNVEPLTLERVIEYLTAFPNHLGLELSLSQTDRKAVDWLSRFWVWSDSFPRKDDLHKACMNPELHLHMLPSNKGLRKIGDGPLFRSRGEHPTSVANLMAIGLPFLDPAFSVGAEGVLDRLGLVGVLHSVHKVLDALPSISADAGIMEVKDPASVLRYFAQWLGPAKVQAGPLTEAQTEKLAFLPIYPIFEVWGGLASDPGADVSLGVKVGAGGLGPRRVGQPTGASAKPPIQWKTMPRDVQLYTLSRPAFVPQVEGVVFLDAEYVKDSILEVFSSPDRRAVNLAPNDLLSLIVDTDGCFASQSMEMRLAVLTHVASRMFQIPVATTDHLKSIPFVQMADGSYRVPGDVIDPQCEGLSAMFKGDEGRTVANGQEAVLEKLRVLRLLRTGLTKDMIEDRIKFIDSRHSEPSSLGLAKVLLKELQTVHFVETELPQIDGTLRWIPTTVGSLTSANECRDGKGKPNLYNRVYAIASPDIPSIPAALQKHFGWDKPIPFDVILQQFEIAVDEPEPSNDIVQSVIKELAARFQKKQVGSSELSQLRNTLENACWVPTSKGKLVRSSDSVFSGAVDLEEVEIYLVYPPLSRQGSETREFLLEMGCLESLTSDMVLKKLAKLEARPPLQNVLTLLKALPQSLSSSDRKRVRVPDINKYLRPLESTFYNDLGQNGLFVPHSDDRYCAHGDIDITLANKLGMRRLGLVFNQLQNVGRSMGVEIFTQIQRALQQQYTEKQFLVEFLANAVDAHATLFEVVVSSARPGRGNILTPEMIHVLDADSLLVYNNMLFTEPDFDGLLKTTVGGKAERLDSIGKFGLGALTMFHFTELATVVSGDRLLILNPSKEFMPNQGYTALSWDLNFVRKHYPGNLANIEGFFDFTIDSEQPFQGTIFYLPLRNDSASHRIIDRSWTPSAIEYEIVNPFMHMASECLFFTNMEEVAVCFSDAFGNASRRWSVETSLQPIDGETNHLAIHTITERVEEQEVRESAWLVARDTIDGPSLGPPRAVQDAINAGRIRVRRPAAAGVAVALSLKPDSATEYKYFSDLPVTERTGIPAHLMATFVLSPDRRQIRFDDNNVVELEYNRWLLSDAIPPLYLEVLEYLARNVPQPEIDNGKWWPKQRKTETISKLTVEFKNAFYGRHLRETHLTVFNSKFCPGLVCNPRDAILLDNEPPYIRSLLEKMGANNVVDLGQAVREEAHKEAGVAVVKQEVLAYHLRSRPDVITSQFWESDSVKENMKDLEQVLRYLINDENAEHIVGLPLLPLADGTFGTFDRATATSPTYFVWKRLKVATSPIFPLNRFVHHSLSGKHSGINEVLDKINVRKLSPDDVVRMLEERFGGERELVSASSDHSTFTFDFWKAIGRGTLEDGDGNDQQPIVSALERFPLVPTSQEGYYVSLRHCRTGLVLVLNQEGVINRDILECLSALGLHFITTYSPDFPPPLRELLTARALPSFDNIIDALSHVGGVAEAFHQLHPDRQLIFAEWARENMVNISPEQIPNARLLPIWPAARGDEPDLAAARDTFMLPEGLDYLETAPFMDCTVSNHGLLSRLEGPSLTPEAVLSRLRFPSTLSNEVAQRLVRFLYTLLELLPPTCVEPVPVPNTNSVFIPSNRLFAREPLFTAAFGENSVNFVAAEFAGLEALLIKHGLRSTQTLDIAGYQTCAEAIDALPDNVPDKVPRAEVVWSALPDIVRRQDRLAEGDIFFSTLADLRFVPRDSSATRDVNGQVSIPLPEDVTQLPAVVSPNQLVLANMELIAWSQKGRFATQPGALVTSFWRTLGQPQVSDAINHLLYLSRPANWRSLTPARKEAWYESLHATYTYLNAHVEDYPHLLNELSDEEVFLNVADSPGAWAWRSAEQLAFSERDYPGLHSVKSSLYPYRRLLNIMGVAKEERPHVSEQIASTNETVALASLRRGFERLRREHKLIDVYFRPRSSGIGIDETGDSTDGLQEALMAHRAYLASLSEYFRSTFCEGFLEGGVDEPTIDVDFSRNAVALVLNYIYTGSSGEAGNDVELLLEALKLSDYWEIKDLFNALQHEIAYLVNPQDLDQISNIASSFNAPLLVAACEDYRAQNKDFIRRFEAVRHLE